MPETLLEKAQRLGIKPAVAPSVPAIVSPVAVGQPVASPSAPTESLLQKAQRLGVTPAAKKVETQAPTALDGITTVKPTFMASEGSGIGSVATNIAKTAGNIPTSAARLIEGAIVTPAKATGEALSGVEQLLRKEGVKEGSKLLLRGYAGVIDKIAATIYGGAKNAAIALAKDPEKAITDVAVFASKTGVEDPLLIPSLLYTGPRRAITKLTTPVTSAIESTASKVINPVTDAIEGAATKVSEAVGEKAAGIAQREIQTGVRELMTQTKGIQNKIGELKQKNVPIEEILSERPLYEGIKTEAKKLVPDEAIGIIDNRVDTLVDAKSKMLPEFDRYVEKVPREELRKRALATIKGKQTPADEVALANAISNQVDALPESVSLTELDKFRAQARQSARDARGMQKSDSEYAALENAARDIVFEKTDDLPFDTSGQYAALNTYIKNMLETRKFLDKTVRGQVVKGGRLGAYVARTIGAVAGSSGGVLGALAGSELGGLISNIITNNKFGNAFKLRLIKNITDDPAIFKQVEELLSKATDYRPPTPLALPPATKIFAPAWKGGPDTPAVVTGGARAPASMAEAQARTLGKPTFGGLFEYNQSLAKSKAATGNIKSGSQSGPRAGTEIIQDKPYIAPRSASPNVVNLKTPAKQPTNAPILRYTESNAPSAVEVPTKPVTSPVRPSIRKDKTRTGGFINLGEELKKGSAESALIKEATKYKTADEFVKDQTELRLYGGGLDSISKKVDIDSIKPSQFGEELFNDTSRSYARGGRADNVFTDQTITLPKLTKPEILPPIVVDDTGKIIDGNHRWAASKIVGLKEIRVVTKSQLTDIWKKANQSSIYKDKSLQGGYVKNPFTKDPIKKAEAYGFDTFVKDMGGEDEAADFAKQFWAKPKNEGTYYHVTEGEDAFTSFDKAKAANYDPKLRGGGISVINGLYVGKDRNALVNFYGMDKDVKVLKFSGTPKLLNLMDKQKEEKFILDVMKQYGIKSRTSPQLGDALEKEIAKKGYDGVRYFDPYATGEEIVVTNQNLFGKNLTKDSNPTKLLDKGVVPKTLKGVARERATGRGEKYDGVIDDEAYLFIDRWKNADDASSGAQLVAPSKNVIDRLGKYKPATPVKLYRGVRDDQKMGSATGYESWSYSKRVASGFGDRVEERTIMPDEILVDFSKLPKWTEDINGNVEKEVIVKASSKGRTLKK